MSRSVLPPLRRTLALLTLGAFFPVSATILECARRGATGWSDVLLVQGHTPLLWMIDTAPLVLLICAGSVRVATDDRRTGAPSRLALSSLLTLVLALPALLLGYTLHRSAVAAAAARETVEASSLAALTLELSDLSRRTDPSAWRPGLRRMAQIRHSLWQSRPDRVAATDPAWRSFVRALESGAPSPSAVALMRHASESLTEQLSDAHKQYAEETFVVVFIGITVLGMGLPLSFAVLTRLRRAEDDARQQHDFLRQIMDSSSALIVVLQPDGTILQANEAVERLGGVAPAQIVGKPFWETFVADDAAASTEHWLRNAGRDAFPLNFVSEWHTDSGAARWVDWRITATLGADQGVRHLVCTGADITELRRLTAALDVSRQQIHNVTHRARCILWRATVQETPASALSHLTPFDTQRGTVLRIVPEVLNFRELPSWLSIPRTPGAVLEDDLQRARHPDDCERVFAALSNALQTQQTHFSQDYRLIRDDGEELWLREETQVRPPCYDSDGNRRWEISGLSLDNTERKRADAVAEESRARLRHVLEHARCILWEATVTETWHAPDLADRPPLEWRIGTLNPNAAVDWLPLKVAPNGDEIQAIRDALSPADRDAADACCWSALRRECDGYQQVFRVTDLHGSERWLQETVQIQRSADTPEGGYSTWHLVGVITDITERMRSEDLLKAATRELLRSNDSLQEFTSVVAHDLKEPLRKIQMFGNMVLNKRADNLTPEQADYLARMQSAADRMQGLIEGLLAYSRTTQHTPSDGCVDLNALVHEVIGDLEAALVASQGRVEIEPLPVVHGDPLQMRQLFQNLIGNALKFHRPGVAPIVHIQHPGPGLRLTVRDNGIGFAPDQREAIFGIFARLETAERYEGTGIGLSICRRIVEQHGGTLSAEGQPGEGAIFVIDLPLARAVPPATQPRAA